MKKIISVILLLFAYFIATANEDSLVVHSILQQANATQNADSANYYAQQAINYAKKHQYLDGVLDAAKFIGTQYSRNGEQEQAIAYYLQLLSELNFDKKQLSTAYNQIGIYHVYMGHYDSTEFYFLKALQIRKLLNDSLGVSASLNNLGNVTMSKGDYDKAVSYFIKALKMRELLNDSTGIASTTNNLGLIYYKRRLFEEAIYYYRKALSINQAQNDLHKEVLILNNFGNIYDEIHQLDSSEYYYSQSIQKSEEVGDARLIAISLGNMGVTQHKKQNFNEAKKYLQKALKIRIDSEDLEGQSILYNNFAAIYVDTKKLDSAVYFFKKSLALSIQINNKEITRDNYLGLSDAYNQQQQYKKAFDAYQSYSMIKDSILNETTQKQIEEVQTQYETEIKEKEIAEQRAQISEHELKVEQRNYLLYGLVVLGVFILIIGVVIYNQQKLKQKRLIEENRLKDKIAEAKLQNQLHEERLSISSGLNDNIGAQLTYIISSVDNIKHLFKEADEKLKIKLTDVANFTKTTITQLRDTIWALNKDEISFEDLKGRLYNFLETAKLAQDQIDFSFHSELKNQFILNSIQGISIYRIVQEALNNAIKYSAASKVELNILEGADFIQLSIEDDGIGFKITDVILGNGLENMRNRALSMGAEFNLESAPDAGTKITILLNKDKLNAV